MNPSGETILAEEVCPQSKHRNFGAMRCSSGWRSSLPRWLSRWRFAATNESTFAACPIGRCLIRAIRAPCLASPARAAV